MPSKEEQLLAIDTEIARSQKYIKFMESKLTKDELVAAHVVFQSKLPKSV
jgi:hypothetical protein